MSVEVKSIDEVVTTNHLLSARGLRAGYAGRTTDTIAVDDVSLYVNEGEVLGIAGESGCGKSTLAAVLSLTAVPPLHVLAGELDVAGKRLSFEPDKAPPREWRGTVVSLLPQGAMNSLSPTARVGDFAVQIVRAHEGRKVSASDAKGRAAERFAQLDLPARVLDAYPHQLSGGMKQRVVTVLSTLLNPKLLIADEPTSALDVSSQRIVTDLMREMLQKQLVSGIIFVTHDLPVLRRVADRVAIMYAGQIHETGPTEEIINRARHPYTGALIGSVLVPEPQIRTRRISGIKGSPPDLSDPPAGCRFHPRCSLAMDVCTTEQPPIVGDERHYATCWWAKDHPGEPVEAKL
ncbi:ABC transporter ATP-binding protein [Virgisporangium aurantiacum]|uniref:Peptide ABC transporter ATP-binding protein n=1 Tax=Virgisporangium aurantiacum TaxID=175570 RepID=A0A8J4DY53_9ACTN|nr:ABC transporter ATP-binding protein [Virgisporangium aurantiacum]GIJ55285.1 peptide ABC transporter ATP-binding protein [Virgisporangium aurantiacum]